jgi:hypothetical protein
MVGAAAIAAVIVILAAATVAVVVVYRRRVGRLQRELDEMYQAQHILERARDRKHRKHLHLLVIAPLAWLAGKVGSSGARLAVAGGVSAGVMSGAMLTGDIHEPTVLPPPADAETSTPIDGNDQVSSATSTALASPTDSPAVASSPDPAAATRPGLTLPAAPSVEASTPDTTTTTTTSPPDPGTTTTVEIPAPLEVVACLNPQGLPVPVEACP